jgi:hypothetical protein
MATANGRRDFGLLAAWSALVVFILALTFRHQPVAFSGHVDQLSIYKVALAPQEVEAARLRAKARSK